MERILMLAAFGWLTFGGVVHFVIDVVSQAMRGARAPGPATTAYYGLHSSYALSQVLLAACGFLIAFGAPELLRATSLKVVCLVALAAWLTICVLFVEYWQPRLIAGIFGALVVSAAVASRIAP